MGNRDLRLNAEEDPGVVSEAYEESYDEALGELESQGVSVSLDPPKMRFRDASFRGQIPPDLTDLDSKELGTLLGMTKIWHSYVSGLMALSDGERTVLEEALKAEMAAARKRFADTAAKKYEIDDQIRLDSRVVELRRRHLKAEVRYSLLSKSVVPSAEGSWQAVSREITRREQEHHQGTRTGSVARRRRANRRSS